MRHRPRAVSIRSQREAASARHRLALQLTLSAGVAGVGALIARLGADEDWPIDAVVRRALASHDIPRTRAMLRAVGMSGTSTVYVPAAVLAALAVRRRSSSAHARPILLGVAVAAAAAWSVKRVVRRPRPIGAHKKSNEHTSFPSGHATRAAAASFTISYVLVREGLVPSRVSFPIAAAIALATGASRAYADAHWTTDVIGGWALGAAAAAGSALLYERTREVGR